MSRKSDPVSASKKAKTNPFTPMRRFFFKLELFKPIVALGKRVRDHSFAADKPSPSSKFVATTAARNTTFVNKDQGTARIALQQYDQPLDAIVITTLPSYPFCCHEDLLTMSRSQLVQTAVLFNSRLPVCSQIEIADGIPDAHIRHSIETLVGIVPDMPGAPKPIKSRRFEKRSEKYLLGDLEEQQQHDTLPSPPTSPLSMRVSRRQEKRVLPVMMSSPPPHLLERLEEEDENDFFFTMKPPKKKRKVSISMASILCDEDIDMEPGTPTRAQDWRYSQRMIQALKWQQSSPSPISSPDVFNVDSAFVDMSKPRYRRSMGKKKSATKRRVSSGNLNQPGSSRKPIKRNHKQAITLSYRPFELPTNHSGRYHMRTNKLLSSTTSAKSSDSFDEKNPFSGIEDDESDNDTSWLRNVKTRNSGVEHEDNQVAGRIENLRVGCD